MQLNCSGISFKIDDIKAGLGNVKNLSSIDIFKIESYIDMANMYGSDDTSIEQGDELENLKNKIKSNFKDKADTILSAMGISSSAKGVEKTDNTEKNGQKIVREESPTQKIINQAMQDPKFANDKAFQKYAKFINALDSRMSAIEEQYEVTRGKLRTELNIPNDKQGEYSELSVQYRMYSRMINDYIKEMNEWKDGHAHDFQQKGTIRFTNVERITLKNGQHAWKSDQGVFYPYIDGEIGGERVEDSSLYE